MYKLQWTKIIENGKNIPVENFKYEDVNEKRFKNEDEAMKERMQVMLRTPGMYVKVVKI